MQLKDKVAAVIGNPVGIERTLCQHFAKEGALSLLPTWKLIKLDGSQMLLKKRQRQSSRSEPNEYSLAGKFIWR